MVSSVWSVKLNSFHLFQPNLDSLISKVDKFVINQNTLANINDNSNVPKFLILGTIDSVVCSITQPFTGEVSYGIR